MASGLVFGSESSLLWSIQQTPVTARAAPEKYLVRYVGLRRSGRGYRRGAAPVHFATGSPRRRNYCRWGE